MTIKTLAMLAGIELCDLSTCESPKGRVDYLVSKIVEHVVGQMTALPEAQRTYHAARPLIDGLLVKHLGHVVIPVDVMKAAPDIVTTINEARRRA